MVTERGGSDAEIGYRSDTADSVKGPKTSKKSETGNPAIAVSQKIIQDKVGSHCGNGPNVCATGNAKAAVCNKE
jgi:hypothetical protein